MEKYTKYFLPIGVFIASIVIFYFFSQYGFDDIEIVGVVVTYIGFFLWFIGRISLGSSYALLPDTKKLVTGGLYKKIRHPLYYSQMLTMIGFLIFIQEWWLWILLVLITALQYYRLKQKEEILTQYFGREYVEYKKETWF